MFAFAERGDIPSSNGRLALLREWVERGSEAAFSNLVSRHVNLVYSTALRRVRDHASAEEVVQSVFCLLAKKARHLRCDIALVSWLYRTACFKVSRAWRDEQRRLREKDAVLMALRPTMNGTEPGSDSLLAWTTQCRSWAKKTVWRSCCASFNEPGGHSQDRVRSAVSRAVWLAA
jgi:DNA-directed RNA polymerase specialized sigma24 family protein